MNARTVRGLLFCLATLTMMSAGAVTAEAGNRNSGWGWAKPLNDRPGSLLYTSNVAFKKSANTRSSYSYRRSYNVAPRYYSTPVRTKGRLFRRYR